jgi:hypothetical protein
MLGQRNTVQGALRYLFVVGLWVMCKWGDTLSAWAMYDN